MALRGRPVFAYSPQMQGLHLTADLYRCRCEAAWLTDAAKLGPWCVQAAESAGLMPVEQRFAAVPAPGGVAGAVLLGNAHLCLHTWPAQRAATLDVYICNVGDAPATARALMSALVDRFQPEWTEQRSLDRGDGDT